MSKIDAYELGIRCFERGMDCYAAIDWFDRYYADHSTQYRFSLIDGWESARDGNI